MRNLHENEIKLLEKIFKLHQHSLKFSLSKHLQKNYTNVIETKDYLVAIGDIPIALVAHLDTVFREPPEEIFYDKDKNVMWSPNGLGADDRAGVFAILKIINSGLKPHIIFTTDEECGGIGASQLANRKDIFKDLRYIVELDRQGAMDCVFYECNNQQFTNYVENFGFIESLGTFSDISFLCPAWGVAGVNLSIGYKNEHSYEELLYVSPMLATIQKVKNMLKEKDIPHFNYIPKTKTSFTYDYVSCAGCGKPISTEDAFDVKDLNGNTVYFCVDCLANPQHQITFCEKCYDAFQYEDKENIPYYCKKCEVEYEH